MGSSKASCILDIQLYPSARNDYVFTNNDQLRGTVNIKVIHTLAINRIDVVFDGLAKAKTKYNVTTDHIYRETYIKKKVYPNFPHEHNAEDTQAEFLVAPGDYAFPFDITIPLRNIEFRESQAASPNIDGFSTDDLLFLLPPTFNESKFASVNYKLRLFIKGKDLKIIDCTTKKVTFVPRQPEFNKSLQCFHQPHRVNTSNVFALPIHYHDRLLSHNKVVSSNSLIDTSSHFGSPKKPVLRFFKKGPNHTSLSSSNQLSCYATENLVFTRSTKSIGSSLTPSTSYSSLNTYFQNMGLSKKSMKFKPLITSELQCAKQQPKTEFYFQLELPEDGRVVAGKKLDMKLFLVSKSDPQTITTHDNKKIDFLYLNNLKIDFISVTKPIGSYAFSEEREFHTVNLLKTGTSFKLEITLLPTLFEPFEDLLSKDTMYRQQVYYHNFDNRYFWNNKTTSGCSYLQCPSDLIPSFTTAFVSRTYKVLVSGNIQPSTLANYKTMASSVMKNRFFKVYDNITVLSPLSPFEYSSLSELNSPQQSPIETERKDNVSIKSVDTSLTEKPKQHNTNTLKRSSTINAHGTRILAKPVTSESHDSQHIKRIEKPCLHKEISNGASCYISTNKHYETDLDRLINNSLEDVSNFILV